MSEQTRFQRRIAGSAAERQLMLIAVGVAHRRELMRVRAERLARALDWERFGRTLRARRLLPTLGPRVLELVGERADERFVAEVEQSIDSGRRQASFLQLVAMRAMRALGDAGIRSSPLKGPMLSEAIYGDIGRRWSADIDLLVPVLQLGEAVRTVRSLGYEAPTDHVDADELPLLHFSLGQPDERLPRIELHWRVHWYERRFAQERLLADELSQAADWRPEPADELAALLLFYARDGFVDLRLAADLSAWWDSQGERLPAAALGDAIDCYPSLARALAAAVAVSAKIVGLPTTVLGPHAPDWRARGAARLANPHPRSSHPQLYADVSLIDGLLAPPGGLGAFARRQLVPPREVLDQRAQLTQSRRGTSRAGNGLRMLVRYCLAITRLAAVPKRLRYS